MGYQISNTVLQKLVLRCSSISGAMDYYWDNLHLFSDDVKVNNAQAANVIQEQESPQADDFS